MSDNEQILSSEKPIAVNIEEEMRRSYIDYAMSVIIGRALPDVRDGLKPVHRRVLYGMFESGNTAGRAYKKSARIVGDVMGKYHPHGDSAIYDTVVRMAQQFSMRKILVDGQGNFGSIDGDSPAAMRYTEVRLTRLAEEMLREDIDKETVDWVPTYDGSLMEPTVLPSRVPALLINGTSGIAVGMATNIPPHNLGEVVDALLLTLADPEVPLLDLMEVMPGPDFPTAGFIHGFDGIRSAYETGRGTIQMRARARIEEMKGGGDRQQIIVTELPYQVNKARLVERIAALVKEKKIEGISDLRDESDRDGIRVVVDLKRGEVAEVILNKLYKMTQMQSSFGIILLAIVDNRPKVMQLKELLFHFLNHRRSVVIRRTRYDLRKAEERAHILEGLLKALDHLDEVIATIRASQTPKEAKANLVERFSFSEVQAQAILDMRLQKLTGLEREKIVEEFAELMSLIESLRAIMGSDELVAGEIRRELGQLKESYADERRTEIIPSTNDITIEDMIADEPMVITVTRSGYVKRSPLSLYRAQHRGGKGRMGMSTRDEDVVEHLYVATAHSYILVFTESGRVHWIKVHQIPELGPAARGKAIVNLLDLSPDERVATTVAVRDFPDDHFLLFASEKGTIKKTSLSAFSRPMARGIIAIKVVEGDRLLAVRRLEPGHDVLLATAKGYAIRFSESDARAMGRVTQGVRGIRLREGDRVVAMAVLDTDDPILTVSERGYGKRTAVAEYRTQSRGGLGIINLKLSERTGAVIGVRQVAEEDGAMLITQDGKIILINVADVSVIGRATQGVRVMKLGGNDRLVALAKVEVQDEDENNEGGESDEDEGNSTGATEPLNAESLREDDTEPDDTEPDDTEPDGTASSEDPEESHETQPEEE